MTTDHFPYCREIHRDSGECSRGPAEAGLELEEDDIEATSEEEEEEEAETEGKEEEEAETQGNIAEASELGEKKPLRQHLEVAYP
jgi:hypothetical protein